MNILEEVREYFASIQDGARRIKSLPDEYPALVIRNSNGYGVAIRFDNEEEFSEKFANCRMFTEFMFIEGEGNKYLVLSTTLNSLWYEFATICTQFIEPGENGIYRKNLLEDPLMWWKQWRKLLGNAISEKTIYDVLAEMLVLDMLYAKDHTVVWTSINGGTHDIESNTESYEVKSTVRRYGTTITISGQHQLESNKRLQLYFCRLEKSNLGISINDMKEKLVSNGYDNEKIEEQLYRIGYERGSSARNEKYKVLEKRKYEVNNKFPKITKFSFKNNHIPKSIIQIVYTIDLDGLEYETW